MGNKSLKTIRLYQRLGQIITLIEKKSD